MTNVELVSAADVQLMQGLAQRVTALRPDLIGGGASYGELAWVWGQGQAAYGPTFRWHLWFSDGDLVAWAWAFLPCQVRRNDGSVRDVTGAELSYQVHPEHAGLVPRRPAQVGRVRASRNASGLPASGAGPGDDAARDAAGAGPGPPT
jgi:hypothetical protein